MKTLFKVVSLLFIGLFETSQSVASAQEATFGYVSYEVDVPEYVYGTLVTETYDVAIALRSPYLVGKRITSITVPIIPSTFIEKSDGTEVQCVDSLSFWLTKELTLSTVNGKKTNVPDIATIKVQMPNVDTDGWNHVLVTCQLQEPYTIPAEGVYVGYSLNVAAVDEYSNSSLRPIFITPKPQDGGMFIHSSRTYRKWADRSAEMGVVSMLTVGIEGDIPSHAAYVSDFENCYVQAGEAGKTSIKITNLGTSPIESIDYTVTVNGTSADKHLDLTERIPAAYTYTQQAFIELPSISAPGSYDASISITKVNGNANGIDSSCKGIISALGYLPVHRPLVEELSGTSCGYCPRGIEGLEWMSEHHPDDFIAVVWHGFSPDDPMYPKTVFPNDVYPSAPNAFVDRYMLTDPYYGESQDSFGFPAVWQSVRDEFTPVDITVEAEWVDASNPTQIRVNSTVNWSYLPSDMDAEYRIEYILTGDDITGDGPSWLQSNNYSGAMGAGMELMESWSKSGSAVRGVHYNDVGLISSGGRGVAGSVPSIQVGVPTTHTYTFSTADAVHITGTPIPYKADRLNVIAVLLKDDGMYGRALNANKCKVPAPADGISDITNDSDIVAVRYYDMMGLELTELQPGTVCLRVITYADGTVATEKITR